MVFVDRQLECNATTNYFCLDHSLPQEKLSQAEMVEINRLYRTIGRCETRVARLRAPEPPPKKEKDTRLFNPYAGGALLLLAGLLLYYS